MEGRGEIGKEKGREGYGKRAGIRERSVVESKNH